MHPKCLSWPELAHFLRMVEVDVILDYPFMTILSESPRLYIWADGLFCHSVVAA